MKKFITVCLFSLCLVNVSHAAKSSGLDFGMNFLCNRYFLNTTLDLTKYNNFGISEVSFDKDSGFQCVLEPNFFAKWYLNSEQRIYASLKTSTYGINKDLSQTVLMLPINVNVGWDIGYFESIFAWNWEYERFYPFVMETFLGIKILGINYNFKFNNPSVGNIRFDSDDGQRIIKAFGLEEAYRVINKPYGGYFFGYAPVFMVNFKYNFGRYVEVEIGGGGSKNNNFSNLDLNLGVKVKPRDWLEIVLGVNYQHIYVDYNDLTYFSFNANLNGVGSLFQFIGKI
jgi:hypothetical protein